MNRRFCLCSNNSIPQRIWGSCERTSLKVVFWSCDQDARLHVCVSVYECVWFGLRLLIWSWHYRVKLVFFFLLLCLASCSHHLAPGFENQAKSLPPEWHENIPTYTQPSCHSLSSQPQTMSKDNMFCGLNGIQRNFIWLGERFWDWKYTWKWITANCSVVAFNPEPRIQRLLGVYFCFFFKSRSELYNQLIVAIIWLRQTAKRDRGTEGENWFKNPVTCLCS